MTRRLPGRIVFLLAAIAVLTSCAGIQYRYSTDKDVAALLAGPEPAYPQVRFAVMSDTHLYDPALGTTGAAFQAYMDEDRKLLPESEEILQQALGIVKGSGAGFLLISGDLTKDGEKQDHVLMARYLSEIAASGIKVYVVPGNHDILNPDAKRFMGDTSERVPNVTPAEFADIYKDFGYGQALMRDPASLSYVAEPAPGLWLLALDACDYADNEKKGKPETDGRFTQDTVTWIENVLADALRRGKAVIAMMHHGILEHYAGQEKYFGDYIVDDYQNLSAMFAAYGVRMTFTGHYHAQDITLGMWVSGFLYDIETGSLVSPPNPVRIVDIGPSQEMRIESRRVTELPSFTAAGRDFMKFSEEFIHGGIAGIAINTMVGLGVPAAEAEALSPQIADAFIAHYNGDERFTGTETLRTTGLSFMGGLVVGNRKALVAELWEDLPPSDNNVTINLGSGQWK